MFDLEQEAAKAKGGELVRLIEQDIRDRRPALDQKLAIRNLYYGISKRKLRYPGQPNIHLHVMAEKIETFVSKEMNAFWAVEPHAHAKRVPKEFDEDETGAVESMVNYALDTDIPNFYRTFESWLRNRHLDSVSVVKAWYNYEERYTVMVEEAATEWLEGDIDFSSTPVPEQRAKVPYEILASTFAKMDIRNAWRGEVQVDPLTEQELDGLEFHIDFIEDETEYRDIHAVFRDAGTTNEIDILTYRPYPVKDNVEVEIVEFDDLIVPYRTKDLQSAPRLAQKYWLTMAEIRKKTLEDGWNITEEELALLKNRSRIGRRENDEPQEDSKRLKDQKDVVTGQQDTKSVSVSGLEPYHDDKVMILECYAREDLDNDGTFEEVIYQIPYAIKKVVHGQYLEELFPHGRRPFADLHSIPVSERYYGWSLGQMLAPTNIEANVIINSVNEAQELINNPFFFYVPTAMPGDPKLFTNLVPGQGVPIAEKDGVIFPRFQQQPLANLSTLDSILLFADRMTISPQAVGSSQVRNAPRTARGTLALLSEAGAKVDSFITAAQKGGWSELMYQIYALYEAYGTREKWQKVTGRPKPPRSKPVDIQNRVKFVFKGNSVNTNKEVKRTIAQVRYNTLMANPMYTQDPNAMLALIEDFLRHFSEGTDIEKLMPRLPAQGGGRQPMPQESETEIMLQGVPLDVLPIDNDQEHLGSLEVFRRSKRFENLTQDKIAIFGVHYVQHQRQMLMKQQQSQGQPGGTEGNNVPLGITQDLNSLEGGNI